jgi:hypothetical protein
MSKAAYDLQCRATSHSASCGHPGYVPDDYLEHLDGLGIETTITAAELCAIGTWERAGSGYRILDWEAVEYALDWVREHRGEDPGPSPRNGTTKPASGPAWPRRSRLPRHAPRAVPPEPASSSWPPASCPPDGTSGPAPCKPASSGGASQDSGTCCSKASPPATGTATPSTPAGPGGSPRRSGLPSASPRSAQPGSTTMPGSARTATLPTATSTGTSPNRDTAIAPAATAKAWTRTGKARYRGPGAALTHSSTVNADDGTQRYRCGSRAQRAVTIA